MLIGERTTLRPLERQDLPVIAAWRNDPEVRPLFFTPHLIAVSDQGKWYDAYLSRGDSAIFIIQVRGAQQGIGMIGLDHIDHRNQRAEYGRMLIAEPQQRRHGYARDATGTLLHYAFTNLNLNRVYLRVYADNAEALGLYERCGFEREGVEREAVYMGGRFRDLVLMSILRREFASWQSRMRP